MPQERADFVGRTRREDVLELTGLLFDFRFAVHGEAVGEESFRQPVAPNNAAGATAASRGKGHDSAAIADENSFRTHGIVAGIHERLVLVRFWGMRARGDQAQFSHLLDRDAHRQRAVDIHVLDFGLLAVFFKRP